MDREGSASRPREWLPVVAACLIGAGPGLMVVGRGALQGALALGLLLALVALVRAPWRAHLPEVRPVLAGLGIIFTALLPSVLSSQDVVTSATTWARTAFFLVGGIPFYLLFRVRPDLTDLAIRSLLVVAAPTFAIAALFCLILYAQPEWTFVHGGLPGQMFMRLKPAASTVACLAPLAVWASWKLEGRWRILAAVLFLAGLILVWRTGSKATLAGLLVAGAILVALGAYRLRQWWLMVASGAVAVPLAVAWLMRRQRVYETDIPTYMPEWLVDPHRQNIWKFTFERFLEHPWLGWGLNTINTVPGANLHVPGLSAEYIPSHPHSWLIELLSEGGVVGAVPFLAVLAVMLIGLVRRATGTGNGGAMALLAVMTAYLVSGLFNFSLWAPWWMLAMVATVAMAAALDRQNWK